MEGQGSAIHPWRMTLGGSTSASSARPADGQGRAASQSRRGHAASTGLNGVWPSLEGLSVADSLGAALALSVSGVAFAAAERGGTDPFLVVYALAGAIGVLGVLTALRTRP